MRALLWLLALFAAAVAVVLLARQPGYVQIVLPPWRIELSLALFAFILLLLIVLGYALLRLFLLALHLPQQVRAFRRQRAERASRAALVEALYAYFEGRYAAAEKAAVRAMQHDHYSALNAIIAARAAHEQHAFERRDAYLAQAQGHTVGDDTLRLLTRAEFNLDQKQPRSALESLKELNASGLRKHVGALTLELKAQQQSRNWDAVLDVLRQLEKRNALDAGLADQLRQQAWLEKLRAAAHEAGSLRAVLTAMPAAIKRRAAIARIAAQALRQLGECVAARQLLTDSLNAQWDSELVALYGDCLEGSAVAQIEQAERWLAQHPDDAGLLLALGKLCLHQELWGKAQNYLDASISVQPSKEAYTALAHLAEKMHQPDAAFRYYRLAADSPPMA
ncbi:MAG: heme biosynthesis protein HemY [Sideroxydans sp.]